MLLTAAIRSVSNLVGFIVFPGVPAQIFQSIVSWVAIIVARLHTLCRRPHKGLQNQPVNLYVPSEISLHQYQNLIAILVTSLT